MSQEVDELAEILWNYHRLLIPTDRADVIIGLGSYDLRVADRCAELFDSGVAPAIVFSGAQGNWTREKWDRPEAEVFAERAVEMGIPESAIIKETGATNIGANFQLTKSLLKELGYNPTKILVVTKPNTLRRALATAAKVWPEVSCFTDCPRFPFPDQPRADHSPEALVNEMVGDIERIQKYPALGFQIPQEVPEEVQNAYRRLIDFGFDQHTI